MIEPSIIFLLAQKEVRDALRNRWFVLYTLTFAVLALVLSYLTLSGAGLLGFAGFGRTTATLINLVLLIVPLMALTIGALSLATERERGMLTYLLAQPLSRMEIFFGKYLGLAVSLLAALFLGFGAAGGIMALRGSGGVGPYLGLVGLSFMLALTMLSVGFLVSCLSSRSAIAVGIALFLWLVFVFFGDLGMMGTALVARLQVQQLFIAALLNPLQVFKIAAILNVRGTLEVLGPAGMYAVRTYGGRLMPLLVGILCLWTLAPLMIGYWIFRQRGEV